MFTEGLGEPDLGKGGKNKAGNAAWALGLSVLCPCLKYKKQFILHSIVSMEPVGISAKEYYQSCAQRSLL